MFVLLAATSVRADELIGVLVVDGNGAAGSKKGGDAYYVEAVLKSVKGYAPAIKDAAELEKQDLKKYPVIFLLDVPELSEPARTNLESHVRAGAGAAFFLGDKIKSGHYNRQLYRKAGGLFPVELASRPTAAFEEKPKGKAKAEPPPGRTAAYVRDRGHPLCADLADATEFFKFLDISRYYPVVRAKRDQVGGGVQELIALPNDDDITNFKEEAQKLNRALPVSDEKYKEFRPGLERHQWAVRQALIFGKRAWELGDALDGLLEDRGDPKDAEKPDLTQFWPKPELKELRQKLVALRDKSRYSDPLVVAGQFGKGRVAACMTSAGGNWNDWADGPASPTFVILTANMAKYLTRGDEEKRR